MQHYIQQMSDMDKMKSIQTVYEEEYSKYFQGKQIEKIQTVCLQNIEQRLMKWNGIHKSDICRNTNIEFRDYFKVGKNSWDQRKINIMCEHFWIPLITIVKEVFVHDFFVIL